MYRLNAKFIIIMSLFVILALSACRAEAPSTEIALGSTAVPSDTPEPTVVPTETASVTPAPTDTETPVPTDTPTVIPTPISSGPTGFPIEVNPLTGLSVSDPDLLNRNPVMVKIANFPRGLRPHSGLSWADLVFEHYIGAGATRYTAIFYGSNPPETGPVRSARLLDGQLGTMYNAIFAFASADAFVYNRILARLGDFAISEGPNTCPVLCRIGTGDVNSVRAYPELLTDYAENERNLVQIRPNLDGMHFDPDVPEGGEDGQKAIIQYSTSTISEWRYDAARQVYTRFIEQVDQNGNLEMIPLVDRLTDAQLTADNVLVLFVETIEYKPTLHDYNLLTNPFGHLGFIYRNGQVYEVRWKPQTAQQPLQIVDANGDVFPLKPGNSWVHVIGVFSAYSEDTPGVMTYINYLP